MTPRWLAPLLGVFVFAVALALTPNLLAPAPSPDDAGDLFLAAAAAALEKDGGLPEVYNGTHSFAGTPTGIRHDTFVVREDTPRLRVEVRFDAEPAGASAVRLHLPDGAEALFCRSHCEVAVDSPSPGMWRLDYEGADEATAHVVVHMHVSAEAPAEFVYDVTRTFPPELTPRTDFVRAIDGFLVHEGQSSLLINVREDASVNPTMVRLRGPDGELRTACGITCTVSPATPGLWRIEYANMPLGGTVRVMIEAA